MISTARATAQLVNLITNKLIARYEWDLCIERQYTRKLDGLAAACSRAISTAEGTELEEKMTKVSKEVEQKGRQQRAQFNDIQAAHMRGLKVDFKRTLSEVVDIKDVRVIPGLDGKKTYEFTATVWE